MQQVGFGLRSSRQVVCAYVRLRHSDDEHLWKKVIKGFWEESVRVREASTQFSCRQNNTLLSNPLPLRVTVMTVDYSGKDSDAQVGAQEDKFGIVCPLGRKLNLG